MQALSTAIIDAISMTRNFRRKAKVSVVHNNNIIVLDPIERMTKFFLKNVCFPSKGRQSLHIYTIS